LEEYLSSGGFRAELYEIYLKLLWEAGKRKAVVEHLEKFLKRLKKKQKQFKCQNCGYQTDTFDWMCPRCRSWESLELNSEV